MIFSPSENGHQAGTSPEVPMPPGAPVLSSSRVFAPARAAAEQICRKVKQGVQALQSAVGFLPAFVLSGGQAKNPLWNQMKADITGAEFLLTQTADAELLGGAIIAFCADGEFSSYGEACAAMVKIKTRFSPDPARAALYAEKFAHS